MTAQITASPAELNARAEVSAELLQEHLNVFSTLFRDSGSEDERKAAEYIADKLTEYGVQTHTYEFKSLISWPLEGKLEILDADANVAESITTRTRAFGMQTPEGGCTGELVFVPFAPPAKGEMIFTHREVGTDYSGIDVKGKIVITADGGPDGIRRAQENGAAGHIHIWPSDEPVVHEMIGTSVWGTPTPDSEKRRPNIPVLGVSNADGERIAEMVKAGTVHVRIESNVKTEWMTLPLVTGFIPGSRSEDYLLVGAHIDSWYEGITDNATGDVALLEMARVLNMHRDALTRGVRFAWWPGHSTGRYSGSTWFADTQFAELRKHAIGFLMIDSPGVRETELWDCRYNMGEIEHITRSSVEEITGQHADVRRPLKAGDESFLGVGLPSLGAFPMLPIDHPHRKAVGGGGGAYWWHTPEDTLDKADANNLAVDTTVYIAMTFRMIEPELIPYNFVPSANDFINELSSIQDQGGQHLDLRNTIALAERFRNAATALAADQPTDVETRNELMKKVTHQINPALYTIAGPFEFDPALQLPILPGLAPVKKLATLEFESDDYFFLQTSMMRQRNRIETALLEASELIEAYLG
jgi:hypothetical protein